MKNSNYIFYNFLFDLFFFSDDNINNNWLKMP